MKKWSFILFSSLIASLFGCQDNLSENEEIPSTELSLSVEDINSPQVLGRILFYDPKLSVNNSTSCASCHKQAFGFADNVAFSPGFENRFTTRNSMPIQNISSFTITNQSVFDDFGNLVIPVGTLFWDGRESDLSEMALKPIVNHREMGLDHIDQLVEKLSEIEYYQEGFSQVYWDNEINEHMIGDALASFLSSIVTFNTKFDQSLRGETVLTAEELQGQRLFIEKYECNSCHQAQEPNGYIFSGGTFSNIGLDAVYTDSGLEEVTGLASDNGKFKIPSLRNVALTAPYMHDGRFNTLEEVIDHYSTGLSPSDNLDPRLKNDDGTPLVLNITSQEKRALVAFLNTLTDLSVVADPELSNPFISK